MKILGLPPFDPHPSGPTLRPPPFGPPPFGPPPLRAPTPPGPHPFRPPPKTKLAKCGLAKFGQQKLAKFCQIRMAKCGQLTLAKCGIGQIRFGQMRPNKDGQIKFGQMRSRPVKTAPISNTGPYSMASSDLCASSLSSAPRDFHDHGFFCSPARLSPSVLDRAPSGLVDTTWYDTLPLRECVVPAKFSANGINDDLHCRRQYVYAECCVVSGTTTFREVLERMTKELTASALPTIKVFTPPEKKYLVCRVVCGKVP